MLAEVALAGAHCVVARASYGPRPCAATLLVQNA